ncbi:MAG: antitoxin [Caulobacter sp.]|nr:antitoxin [Caulobacter sp.]
MEIPSFDDWKMAAIEEGLRAAEEGCVVDHDVVAAWVSSWDTDDEKPMPRAERF